MKDMLEARKRGDLAFRDKDFRSAIDCYSQVFILQCTENGQCLRESTPFLVKNF